MLILQAFFLWLMVSIPVIGGAIAFRRFFPHESPWFGFLIPPLAFVILINFVEHFIALPTLLFLAPLFLGFTIWSLFSPKFSKEGLLLPSLVFLGSFAFTFGIRCLQPDINYTSDGLADLNKINNFCQGDVLPPMDTWLPPFRYEWYYSLQHYAASVVKRLFDIKLGVAYNVSHALLSALTCVVGAAAAYRISGGKTWITLAIPFLIESAATGSSAYIQLTMHDPSLWLADNLSGAFEDPANNSPDNPLWKLLAAPYHERLELQVPGFWTWRDEYHANASGHFLTLFAVFVTAELVHLGRTNWPWVMAALIPVIAVVSSTWAFPITFMLCAGTVVAALFCGRRPEQVGITLIMLFAGLILIWPAFNEVTSSPEAPSIMLTQHEWAAPFWEFVIQWWPIGLLWIYGCFYFRELSFGIRCVMIVVPIMLIGLEWITIEGRYNTIEKMWGYTYGVALIALFPFVASRRGIASRLIVIVLLASASISLCGWLRNASTWLPKPLGAWPDAEFHLEGDHYLRANDQKKKILQILTQVKHATFLTGKSIAFNYYESPAPAVFTENRSFSTWTYFESVANYADVAQAREKLNNDFYSGAMTNRLQFLQSNNITGVLIWPDNDIPNDFLDALAKELDPSYQYMDCRGDGDKNAGVFLLRTPPGK
jgi:Uncharacterized membrane protein (DUF2298)